jgi:hypothetical protein
MLSKSDWSFLITEKTCNFQMHSTILWDVFNLSNCSGSKYTTTIATVMKVLFFIKAKLHHTSTSCINVHYNRVQWYKYSHAIHLKAVLVSCFDSTDICIELLHKEVNFSTRSSRRKSLSNRNQSSSSASLGGGTKFRYVAILLNFSWL